MGFRTSSMVARWQRLATVCGAAALLAVGVGAGVSAQTEAGDTSPPSAPAVLQVTQPEDSGPNVFLTWYDAWDDVGVVRYDIFRNGVLVASTTPEDRPSGQWTNEAWVEVPVRGASYFQIEAIDAAGNISRRSAPVLEWVEIGNPTAPGNVTATYDPDTACVTIGFTNSPGDFLVRSYGLFSNGQGAGLAPGSRPSEGGSANSQEVCYSVRPGVRYIQVQAYTYGGHSVKSPPVRIDVPRIPTPTGFGAVIDGDSVTFTWETPHPALGTIAITDAGNTIGEFGPADSGVTIALPPSKTGDGRHWFQIQGIDTSPYAQPNVTLRSQPILLTE